MSCGSTSRSCWHGCTGGQAARVLLVTKRKRCELQADDDLCVREARGGELAGCRDGQEKGALCRMDKRHVGAHHMLLPAPCDKLGWSC